MNIEDARRRMVSAVADRLIPLAMQSQLAFFRTSLALIIAVFLSACSSGFDAVSGTVSTAMDRLLPEGLRPHTSSDQPRLDPRFRYLRATMTGSVAYFVLGYEEPDPQASIEVWYSGTGQVLKLQHGRLDGASGLPTEWRDVDLSKAPTWRKAAESAPVPVIWARTRDVMPGYRYGVEDRMTLKRVPVPKKTALQRIDPSRLLWFQETTVAAQGAEVPPAIYGVEVTAGGTEVVYSEQCVAVDFCFTLQKWPLETNK